VAESLKAEPNRGIFMLKYQGWWKRRRFHFSVLLFVLLIKLLLHDPGSEAKPKQIIFLMPVPGQ